MVGCSSLRFLAEKFKKNYLPTSANYVIVSKDLKFKIF